MAFPYCNRNTARNAENVMNSHIIVTCGDQIISISPLHTPYVRPMHLRLVVWVLWGLSTKVSGSLPRPPPILSSALFAFLVILTSTTFACTPCINTHETWQTVRTWLHRAISIHRARARRVELRWTLKWWYYNASNTHRKRVWVCVSVCERECACEYRSFSLDLRQHDYRHTNTKH